MAALEFRGRAAAAAANGNFLALWGPPSANQFCGGEMCSGGRPRGRVLHLYVFILQFSETVISYILRRPLSLLFSLTLSLLLSVCL